MLQAEATEEEEEDPNFKKLGMYTMVLSSSQRRTSQIPPISLCLYLYPLIAARQRLG
jgi:hypothetical protein